MTLAVLFFQTFTSVSDPVSPWRRFLFQALKTLARNVIAHFITFAFYNYSLTKTISISFMIDKREGIRVLIEFLLRPTW